VVVSPAHFASTRGLTCPTSLAAGGFDRGLKKIPYVEHCTQVRRLLEPANSNTHVFVVPARNFTNVGGLCAARLGCHRRADSLANRLRVVLAEEDECVHRIHTAFSIIEHSIHPGCTSHHLPAPLSSQGSSSHHTTALPSPLPLTHPSSSTLRPLSPLTHDGRRGPPAAMETRFRVLPPSARGLSGELPRAFHR
ncbi:unnamed protein product, partial [Vitrella brassicaformis CCMP3155]